MPGYAGIQSRSAGPPLSGGVTALIPPRRGPARRSRLSAVQRSGVEGQVQASTSSACFVLTGLDQRLTNGKNLRIKFPRFSVRIRSLFHSRLVGTGMPFISNFTGSPAAPQPGVTVSPANTSRA